MKNFAILKEKTDTVAVITRKRCSLQFTIPVTDNAPDKDKNLTAEVHVFYDVRPQEENQPHICSEIHSIVAGETDGEAGREGRIAWPPVDDDCVESIGSLFNDMLQTFLESQTSFLVDNDDWAIFFDELLEVLAEKTDCNL